MLYDWKTSSWSEQDACDWGHWNTMAWDAAGNWMTFNWAEWDGMTWADWSGVGWLVYFTGDCTVSADGRSAVCSFTNYEATPLVMGTGGSGVTFNGVAPTTITVDAPDQLRFWMPTRPVSAADIAFAYSTTGGGSIEDANGNVCQAITISGTNNSTYTYPTSPQRAAMTRQARRN
jgi:hypothetical protein